VKTQNNIFSLYIKRNLGVSRIIVHSLLIRVINQTKPFIILAVLRRSV